MSNLRALLHHEVLLATYDKGGAGTQTPLFDRFYQNPQNLVTDEAAFLQRPDTKTAAPLNRREASARQLTLEGKTKKAGAMFHVFNTFRLGTDVFQGLREPESEMIQEIAMGEIADQMDHFARRHLIQKELLTAKMLVNGVVYHDQATGQIVETSGATVESIDFGVDANHQGTANGLALPFDDESSDIETMIENIRIQAETENAPPPTLAICNSTLKPYLRANTNFRTFGANNAGAQQMMLNGQFIENLFGINWLFYDRTYVDSSGTTRKFIPDEKLILVPEDNGWLQAVQGLNLVPTTLDVGGMDAEAAARSMAKVYGKFGYSLVSHNPPGIDVFVGDNYGYILRDANALWQLDVVYS